MVGKRNGEMLNPPLEFYGPLEAAYANFVVTRESRSYVHPSIWRLVTIPLIETFEMHARALKRARVQEWQSLERRDLGWYQYDCLTSHHHTRTCPCILNIYLDADLHNTTAPLVFHMACYVVDGASTSVFPILHFIFTKWSFWNVTWLEVLCYDFYSENTIFLQKFTDDFLWWKSSSWAWC